MGIIPYEESPWGWAPPIRSGMAVDAINVSVTCCLTAVQPVLYYITDLGASCSPKSSLLSYLSSVLSVFCLICLLSYLSYLSYSSHLSFILTILSYTLPCPTFNLSDSFSLPCALLCAVPLLNYGIQSSLHNRADDSHAATPLFTTSVARYKGTSILVVTR